MARERPSVSCDMAAQATADSRSGPASAHSETRRPRKNSLSPMTAIRFTNAARASSLSTENSSLALRGGATSSVPSTLLPLASLMPTSPPLLLSSSPNKSPARAPARARPTPLRTARSRVFSPPRHPPPGGSPCAPRAHCTRSARKPGSRAFTDLLLGTNDADQRLAGDHEHLLPAPLIVHEVGIDFRIVGVGRPHAAIVPQGLVGSSGEDLVVLHGPHHTTPTLRSW